MRVLITGGAGYIGSVVLEQLLARGTDVRVVDDLSKGHRAALPKGVPLHVVNIHDEEALLPLLDGVDGVIHLAAESLVAESLSEPIRYFRSNVAATATLLSAMRRAGGGRIVFSSTAATYGDPQSSPIREEHVVRPLNPYGESKLAAERLLDWTAAAGQIGYVTLRYFNAAGATNRCGEDHDPETHLIPICLKAALDGGPAVPVFGTDYPTPDGTCVRDYVHVEDIAQAHLVALDKLSVGERITVNIGSWTGTSVREILDVARRVTGRAIPSIDAPRRAGDPPSLVASGDKARDLLGFTPSRPDIADIIESAWRWLLTHPAGYHDTVHVH
jgi:UDP-glucose 4-epimerase